PSSFNRTAHAWVPGARTRSFTGTELAHERFSPANNLRSSGTVRVLAGVWGLTTTAISPVCLRAEWSRLTRFPLIIRAASHFPVISVIASVCERHLQLQTAQVWL